MTSPFGPMVLIADASAAGGAIRTRFPEIEAAFSARDFEFRTEVVSRPSEVESAARAAALSGKRFIVLVGDDRTIHHAVNGLIERDEALAPGTVLGVVAAGSGSDFIQTFGLPDDAERGVAHLEGPNTFAIDVGKVTCVSPGGEPITRYFPNLAQAGLGGAIAGRLRRGRPGRGRRFLAFWSSVTAFRPGTVTIETGAAGTRDFEGTAHNVFVANCQYYGGGMRISPRSWPGDGLLDVLVMTGPRSEAFTLLPSIYRGEHLPHPHIVEMKARSLTLDAERPWPVEADGIPLGVSPARFEVIRQPLRLKV